MPSARSIGCALAATTLFVGSSRADEALDALLRKIADQNRATREFQEEAPPSDGSKDLGVAGSVNFTVLAPPGTGLAKNLCARAEIYRRSAALAWLGEELAAGVEFTHIHLSADPGKDEGLTLLAGPGRALPGNNRMWLTTSIERGLGSTLEHEVTHVVLAARFGGDMPVWANEGIASLADDEGRIRRRQALLGAMVREGSFPSLKEVMERRQIPPTDQRSYAVSVALVEFLLERADRPTLVRFIEDGRKQGWARALERHYDLQGLNDLQREWQQWVTARTSKA